MSSLMQGLGSLKTSQGRYSNLPGDQSGSNSNTESTGFFSSIADGAASIANNARSRVENFSFTGNSDPNNIQNQPEWLGLSMFQSLMALPFVVLTPSKFATSFSLGNLMIVLA
ncbi:hypothetical protein AYI69_g5006 [Smittium culicis]|uniref:Uncharacterized protein n=1 Tax=Smittium culicis TaxID=133412 RepID=A0A1R1Y889_9FUNG|nr:hypothetical protein AYI69_g5150 [Smittium culicis]OMJ23397.1 hypothetical protein AYI69_g5006 [Smittium culicis]